MPVMPASGPLPDDIEGVLAEAERIGYPLMLKASWGGGGRGMRTIHSAEDVTAKIDGARREAVAAFGNGEVYFEKLVERARHVEVQISAIRMARSSTCSNAIVRFSDAIRKLLSALRHRTRSMYNAKRCAVTHWRSAERPGYVNAGTVEFLMDTDDESVYFIEVNPRIQVEHTVTEQVTGIDIVKSQLRIAEGAKIGDPNSFVPTQKNIRLSGHALQCRITTEDPENNFVPDYGRIRAYRGATGFGIRLDGGTAYSGALITPFYDSLLEKLTAWAPTPR